MFSRPFKMATKWGIVTAGKICHDFVTAVRSSPGNDHEFVAVASRNLDSAKEFAAKHRIRKAYGSYEELAKDPEIEVAYVGTITPHHFAVGKLMLESGKHVLMEKPMCMTLEQTRALVDIARGRKRFLMEAVWSRFLPSYQHLAKLLREKAIGDVVHVSANFGQQLTHVDRFLKKSMAGGSLLDLGIYPVNVVSFVYGGEKPQKISAVATLAQDGVDFTTTCSLLYSGHRTAQVTSSILADFPNDLVITGTKGLIKIPSNMWCATTIQTPKETLNFPLPDTVLPCNFINSSGLRYEAMEVRKCLNEGVLESSVMPLEDSITLAEILEEIRLQVGITFNAE